MGKLLTSTGNKLIFGTLGKLVHSDILMPTMYFTVVGAANIGSMALYSLSNLSGTYGSPSYTRHANTAWAGASTTTRTSDTMCDLEEANTHGGWAWSGTYWEYKFVAWNNYAVDITLDVDVFANNITLDVSLPARDNADSIVPADILIATIRYTPSTDTLEFI